MELEKHIWFWALYYQKVTEIVEHVQGKTTLKIKSLEW